MKKPGAASYNRLTLGTTGMPHLRKSEYIKEQLIKYIH